MQSVLAFAKVLFMALDVPGGHGLVPAARA
jgi:hypothetical protein